MSNFKSVIYRALISMFIGACLFVLLTYGAVAHLFPLGVSVMIAMPSAVAINLLGFDNTKSDQLMANATFPCIVNGLLGALVFGLLVIMLQLGKGTNES